MKKTALNAIHKSLGAKMVDFAGFEMPVSYEGVNAEHQTVREHLGVFDVSHMGEILISGPQAIDLVQSVTSNDISKIVDGQAQYAYMPNEKGGIVDDLITYKLNDEQYLMVVNASNIDKDFAWITAHNNTSATVENQSDQYGQLAIQGPKANTAMQKLTNVDLKKLKFYHFEIGEFAGVQDVIISATGYTGSGGIEIYFKPENAQEIWTAVMEAGKDFGIKPIGLAARDTLRLEMGFCLYGNDIDDHTSPFEAKLGWITKFTKDFVNSENLKKEKEQGTAQKLTAFILKGKGIPRQGYDIVDEQGEKIGRVTSGTKSPSTGDAIGMGYVKDGYHQIGSEIFIQVRKNAIPATVVKLPFYKA